MEYENTESNFDFKRGSSVHEATHEPRVINANRMKPSLFCTVPNTVAPLFTYIHLSLGISLLLSKSYFHLTSFGDILPVQQMSVITVKRR